MKEKEFDIFISYRTDNFGFYRAQSIRQSLREYGIKAFLDKQDLRQEKFDDELLETVRSSPNFLLLLTENSIEGCIQDDDWVRKEIIEASNNGKKIIPIFYSGFNWDDFRVEGIPEKIKELESHNAIHAVDEYYDAMIQRIVDAMVSIEDSKRKKKIPLPEIQDTINIANSNLTIIDSFIRGSDLKSNLRKLGFDLDQENYLWTDKILEDLLNEKIDMAFYNKNTALEFNKTHKNKLKILQDIHSAMGGRYFYLLAKKESKWDNIKFSELIDHFDSQTIIGISKNSDRFENLLYILDTTEEQLINKGVKLIDFHSYHGLSIFEMFPDILISAGQDFRYLAEQTGDYIEVINFDNLPIEKKEYFHDNSINSLLVGPGGLKKMKEEDLKIFSNSLINSFFTNINNNDFLSKLKNRLFRHIEKICDDENTVKYIVDKILFETYRIL